MKEALIAFLVVGILAVTAFAFSRRSYYSSSNHPIIQEIKANFALLNPDYAKIPIKEGDSAYTEDKEVIVLCLKNPDTGKYYDINTLMYVALHELAHYTSKNHGHGQEFRTRFAQLLKEGANVGIYNPSLPIPTTYCHIGPDGEKE